VKLEYCVSQTISVAIQIKKWNYDIHGHDLIVTVCYRSNNIINIDLLSRKLNETLALYDHRPLWKTTKGGLVEDLLAEICNKLRTHAAESGLEIVRVTGELPVGRITLECL
jgi:hypothetical protein